MNLDDDDRRNDEPGSSPWEKSSDLDASGGWLSDDLRRLLIPSTMATLLLVGGVCWFRLHLPATPADREQAAVVQVHLLPQSDPAPIPIAVAPQSIKAEVAARADVPTDQSEPTTPGAAVVVPHMQTPSNADAQSPGVKSAPSLVSAPPSSVAVKFQQALLRHIARYQRYPNAARLERLQGTVDTLFSMSRDGTLLGVWVKASSGQVVLDQEALDTIRHAQPLPPIPPELPDRLTIQVLLAFDPS
jgi:protein TonB